MKNIKTEEAKLREGIKYLKNIENPRDVKIMETTLLIEIKEAKLQQLLADKKMFKDAVEKLEKKEIKFVDKTCKRLTLSELLKTLGIQEAEE